MRRWLRRWLVRSVWFWTVVVAPWAGLAQSATTTDALHSMADRAGVIFTGTVTGIHRVESDGESSGAVEVTFAVEQAVTGCVAGSAYTLREWAGLWAANDRRYRVGQRLLMLLAAPGPGGLSAPVDGLRGAIPVVGTAPAVGPASTTTISAQGAAVADLRWLAAAEVVRSATPAPLPGTHGTPLHVTARVQSGSGSADAISPAAGAMPAGEPVVTLLPRLAQWEVSRAR